MARRAVAEGARRLQPKDLRWTCSPGRHNLSVPRSRLSGLGIIGQERAIRAMRMGIQLYAPGYHVFVCGIGGTGRTSTVKRILDRIKSSCPLPLDRCYVHNFRRPDRPRLIPLPRGGGARFREDMERFARGLPGLVRRILAAHDLERKRGTIARRVQRRGDRLITRFEARAARRGFALVRPASGSPAPPQLVAVIGKRKVPLNDLDALVESRSLSASRARALAKGHALLRGELERIAREGRAMIEEMESEVAALEGAHVRAALREPSRRIAARSPGKAIADHLETAADHIAGRFALFRPAEGARDAADEIESLLALLEVNVVLDNRDREECPVVIETLPSYRRLFGSYEKALDPSGNWTTDYRRIRAGTLLAADGGYLVLNADDLFQQAGVWQRLKRALVSRTLEITDEGTPLQAPVSAMIPEPIPINAKVIVIGERSTYNVLHAREPEFRKIFKVLADFDDEMDRNDKNLRQYAAFVNRMCSEEALGRFEARAVAAVAEHGARKAGSRRKLTARFGDIADVLREADFWRRQEGAGRVTAAHVKRAVREAEERGGLLESKVRDSIARGTLRIEVTGRRVGQINGLTVHEVGAHVFGLPARITATAAAGDSGIINIEREARLSGRTYDKGVLIVGGFLRDRFGHDKPLSIAASLAFEQSYGEIEGDSASSAEIYALFSAIANLPLEQGIAVTGSVDQKGRIQPVGGVEFKIEGFFRVCAREGLNGRQGVLIPSANVPDLMVHEEVVEAVRRKRFHVWPVASVDEGIAILTGRPAGARGGDGTYPEQSVMGLVDRRLGQFAAMVRDRPRPRRARR